MLLRVCFVCTLFYAIFVACLLYYYYYYGCLYSVRQATPLCKKTPNILCLEGSKARYSLLPLFVQKMWTDGFAIRKPIMCTRRGTHMALYSNMLLVLCTVLVHTNSNIMSNTYWYIKFGNKAAVLLRCICIVYLYLLQ